MVDVKVTKTVVKKSNGDKRQRRKKRTVKTTTVERPIARTRKGLPGTRNLMRGKKLTTDGRNFLYKYINPCHNDGRHCAGVPLAVSQETVVVSSRVDQTVIAPSALTKLWGANALANDWYLGVFIPPWIDDCCYLFAAAHQPSNFGSLSALISSAPEYDTWRATEDVPNLATTVWYCKISNPMISDADTVANSTSHQDFSTFRIVGRGVTTYLPSDSLSNRGQITASQWNAKDSPVNVNQSNAAGVITATEAGKAILFGEVTPKEVTAADSQAYQREAKYGCYLPIYMNEEDRPFIATAYRPLYATAERNVVGSVDVSKIDNTQFFRITIDTSNDSSTVKIFDAANNTVHQSNYTVNTDTYINTGYDFTDLGVPNGAIIVMESSDNVLSGTVGSSFLIIKNDSGPTDNYLSLVKDKTSVTPDVIAVLKNGVDYRLDLRYTVDNSNRIVRKIYVPNQNTGTIWYQGISGAAPVRVKGRMYIEAEAEPGSNWSGFNQPGAVEDVQALQIAAQVSRCMSHGFTAATNDNGILSKLLSKLLGKIPVVGELLSSLL